MNPSDQIVCYIHNSPFPRSTCHLHHESPRYTGGGDDPDNLVWLCANCHTIVHRSAELHLLGRSGESEPLELFYSSEQEKHRFKEVVSEIIKADLAHKESGKSREKAQVQFEMDPHVYVRLKAVVAEHRYYGRRMSIEKYLNLMIKDHLKKKGIDGI